MPTIKYPYEILQRLSLVDDALVLTAQSIKFRIVEKDDKGEVLSDYETGAQAVSVGGSAGLNLEDFMPAVHAAALLAVEQHTATIAAKVAENAATVAAKDAAISTAASEKATELAAKDAELAAVSAAKNAELATAAAAHAAEKAAKDAELAVKAAEIAAENAVALAAKALAAKIAEVAEVEKDDPERAAKEAEAAQLAAQVAAKDAELEFIKLPEKERRNAEIQAQIDKLQAELDASTSVRP